MAAVSQPPAQREVDKELRGSIRGLLNRAKHDKHNLISVDNNSIVDFLQESNQLVEKVTRPHDQAMETQFFSFMTEQGLEYVNKLKQGGRTYTAGDFIRRLRTHHVLSDTDAQRAGAADPEAFNWAALGQLRAVAELFRSVPVVHHMLGPMDAAPRQKRQVQRQARRKAPLGDAVRPEELEDLQDVEKQETDRNMDEMWRALSDNGGRVPLLDLVINHASFAQTVENLFTLSFLVRDSWVSLEEDDVQGMIVVKRAIVKTDAKDKSKEAERMQFVIPLDMDAWEAWKKVTDASKPPMMKHRKEWRQNQAQQQQQQQQQQEQQEQQQDGQQSQGQRRRQRRQEEEEEGGAGDEAQEPPRQRQRQEQQPVQQRRPSRGPQQQEQQPANRQQRQQRGVFAVKQEPSAAAAAAAAAPAADNEVIVLSSDDDVIELNSDGEDVTPAKAQQPKQRAQMQATQQTQQPATGAQRSGPRVPSRGKRI